MAVNAIRFRTNIDDQPIFIKEAQVINLYLQYILDDTISNDVDFGFRWGTSPDLLDSQVTVRESRVYDERYFNYYNFITSLSEFSEVADSTILFFQPFLYDVVADSYIIEGLGTVSINIDTLRNPPSITGGRDENIGYFSRFHYDIDSEIIYPTIEFSETVDFTSIAFSSTNNVSGYYGFSHRYDLEGIPPGAYYHRIKGEYSDGTIEYSTPLIHTIVFGYLGTIIRGVEQFDQDSTKINFSLRFSRGGDDNRFSSFTAGLEWSNDGVVWKNNNEMTFNWATYMSTQDVDFTTPIDLLKDPSVLHNNIDYKIYYYHPVTNEKVVSEVFTISIDYPIYITPLNTKLLTGVDSSERIHGSILYNGFVYGSSRNETGLIKIDENNFANIKKYAFYDSESDELNEVNPLDALEQVVRIGQYLYMASGRMLIQFNTITEEYKSIWGLSYSHNAPPLAADDNFIYAEADGDRWVKLSPNKLLNVPKFGSSIGTSEGDIVPDESYYPNEQGINIDDPTNYPENVYNRGIAVHSAAVDESYLYLTFVSWDGSDENPFFELHKIEKLTMSAAGYCRVPKSTDDMTQSDTHLFLGPELANPNHFGKDMGLVYIDKETLTLKSLRYLSGISANANGYMALRFGKYLLVGYIDRSIFLLDIDNIDQWETEQYKGEFVDFHFKLDLQSPIKYGVPNEALYDEATKKFYFFIWGADGDESAIVETELTQFDFSEPITVSAQYNREIASNTVSLLASIEGTNEAFTLIDKGFEFDTSIGFETSQSFSVPVLDEFTIDVPDLAESTEYFYRAYLTYEGEAPILSETVSFSYTHIYGLQGKVWETRDKLVFLEGANVGVIKMGESTIHSNLTTDANGEFRLELPDGLSDYMIFGNHIDSTRPIFPKRITPKIIG